MAAYLTRCLKETFVAFEEPQVRPVLPGVAGQIERRLRRRFLETHELLGRGAVLRAFERGDDAVLRRFAYERHVWWEQQMRRRGATHYVDISKHFLHGLHVHALDFVDMDLRAIRLVRDPVLNMRSYTNREKKLALDYSPPDAPSNELCWDPTGWSRGEFYLHAWAETYLRGARYVAEHGLSEPIDLATDQLSDTAAMATFLRQLGLPHEVLPAGGPQNTNLQAGYGGTRVGPEDVEAFQRFRDRLTLDQLRRLPIPDDYDPARLLEFAA
ncbi:MAG: hypothetical protein RIB45_10375 [Marivibrio sp.]|uniref:hypothetical protein n=1 Tax=Marivibrio sp. TaxID=2039719 RepID=UPI0032ED995B